jgi:hypothetical protein
MAAGRRQSAATISLPSAFHHDTAASGPSGRVLRRDRSGGGTDGANNKVDPWQKSSI